MTKYVCDMCDKIISGPNIVQIIKADSLTFCNDECAESWLNAEIKKENKIATNTKARHKEILTAATEVLKIAGGVEVIDALPQEERRSKLRKMALDVADLTDCHIDTARRNTAKAMRRARYGLMQQDGWGGARKSDKLGPPRLPEGQKRQPVSTRLAPGSKELAQAIAEVKELPGWGHTVDQALVRWVEEDQELKVKLAEMGIIVKS